MATAGYVVLATSSNNVFPGAKQNDLLVYSGGSNQSIYLGQSNSTSFLQVSSNIIKIFGNLDVSGSLTKDGAIYSSGGGSGSFGGTSAAISGQIACGSLNISANVVSSTSSTTSASSSTLSVYTGTGSAFTGLGSNADLGAMSMELASSNAYLNFVSWNPAGTSNTEVMRISGLGYVGIATAAPMYPLDVVGTARCTTVLYTSLQQASDIRVKENVSAVDPVWATTVLDKLQVVNYNFIESGPSQPTVGFIAQEVEQVYPIAIKTSTNFVPCDVAVTMSDNGATMIGSVGSCAFAVGDIIKVSVNGANANANANAIATTIVATADTDGVVQYSLSPAIVCAASDAVKIVARITNDFKTIDYNALLSCTIAAMQALTERVATLEALSK